MAGRNPLDRVEVPDNRTAEQHRIVARLRRYVGKVHSEWRPWRVVNLSRCGAVTSNVLTRQLPREGFVAVQRPLVAGRQTTAAMCGRPTQPVMARGSMAQCHFWAKALMSSVSWPVTSTQCRDRTAEVELDALC